MNHHANGILATSTAPAPLDQAILQKGYEAIENVARHLDLCGILAMESFIAADGTLIFNEIAPRPHNSFHWTIEGATIGQFEQAARLAAGLPMRPAVAKGAWRMENLLGQHGEQIQAFMLTLRFIRIFMAKRPFAMGAKLAISPILCQIAPTNRTRYPDRAHSANLT